jgi:large subunit ribosomal protein L17e
METPKKANQQPRSKYAFKPQEEDLTLRAKALGERVHFKPMYEVARVLKGKAVTKAIAYLEDVIAHKRAVPFTRYNEGVVHHAQGHEFGFPAARWPEKSCKLFLRLLNGALGSAKIDDRVRPTLFIANIQVNRAAQLRYRRIHQSHGHCKAYASPPTNVEIVITRSATTTPAA